MFFLFWVGLTQPAWLGRPNLLGQVTGLSQWPGWVAGVHDNARLLQKQVNYNSPAIVASEL
jgi:hypothetical protein